MIDFKKLYKNFVNTVNAENPENAADSDVIQTKVDIALAKINLNIATNAIDGHNKTELMLEKAHKKVGSENYDLEVKIIDPAKVFQEKIIAGVGVSSEIAEIENKISDKIKIVGKHTEDFATKKMLKYFFPDRQ